MPFSILLLGTLVSSLLAVVFTSAEAIFAVVVGVVGPPAPALLVVPIGGAAGNEDELKELKGRRTSTKLEESTSISGDNETEELFPQSQ